MHTTVIIPVYNEERSLHKLLNVLTSFGSNAPEIIVVDNRSTDASRSIAQSHGVTVLPNTTDAQWTIGECRNRGATRASGDILCFLDADCIPKNPHAFFSNIPTVFTPPSTVAAIGPIWIAPSEATFIDRLMMAIKNFLIWAAVAIGWGAGSGECLIIRRTPFQQCNGFRVHLAASEDNDLMQRLAHLGRIRFSSAFTVFTSARHVRAVGWLHQWWEWARNYGTVTTHARSHDKTWKAYR